MPGSRYEETHLGDINFMSFLKRDQINRKHLPAADYIPRSVLSLFISALFLSAFLMFAVQPLFSKMVLPRFGGSPSVWTVALFFFQAALFVGYLYAHALMRWFIPKHAVIVHVCNLLVAAIFLPIGIAEGWSSPPDEGARLWLLGLFAVSIGLPFFALSGNAPLLQAWFSRSGHRHAKDPYFLYGASNVGSLFALLSYPILFEPNFTLSSQSELWSVGYMVLLILVAACSLLMLIQRRDPIASVDNRASIAALNISMNAAPAWHERISWVGLAFVPSGLLVSVTNHISTDVAAVPFLWVLPLALFLLTFIITFQKRPIIKHPWMLAVQPTAIIVVVISIALPKMSSNWLLLLAIHLLAFFIMAMVCHGELIRRRPSVKNLTGFYLWMSFGGMLGGLFAGLMAPQIFSSIVEYPLFAIASLLARPGIWKKNEKRWSVEIFLGLILFAAYAVPNVFSVVNGSGDQKLMAIAVISALTVIIVVLRNQPARKLLFVICCAAFSNIVVLESFRGSTFRGFFGVYRISVSPDKAYRFLKHGTTIHGVERINNGPHARPAKPEMLSYYHLGSGFADVFSSLRSYKELKNIAIIGLGAGILACYKQHGEQWRFYEIDPLVIGIAADPNKFTFLSKCAPEAEIVTGDGRLALAKYTGNPYDVIVLDAFSSDAIPVHLLTIEAIKSYLMQLAEDGVLIFHISNRNLSLAPVLSAAAAELGLSGLHRSDGINLNELDRARNKATAKVLILARSNSHFGNLPSHSKWKSLPNPIKRVWTDDYSDILTAIIAKHFGS